MKVNKDTMKALLKENKEAMRKNAPEYQLDCVVQETLEKILTKWETIDVLFQSYLKREETERLEHYIYCYQWGCVMGSPQKEKITLDSFPKVPELRAHTIQLDQIAKEQGNQLRRLWRRYQTVTWKRRVYESAYVTVLGMRDAQR